MHARLVLRLVECHC